MPPKTPSSSDGEREAAPAAGRFKPPGFLDSLKSIVQPGGRSGAFGRPPRARAQPATGTEADARAVNYVDKRERMIALFLAAFQVILGIVIYVQYHNYVEHPSKKISVAKAHKDTLSYHHVAPELMIVNVVLGLAIAGAVYSKRRALVGFTILLGGLAMNASGGGFIGIVYLGIGIWLVFRSMRKTNSAKAATAGAGTSGRAARNGTAKATGTNGKKATTTTVARKPPSASRRYTPPSRKPAPAKATAVRSAKEPEKESRLTSWLHR